MEWTWAFYLDQVNERQTRLQFRMRGVLNPWWLLALYQLFIVPADFVMGRGMCLVLRKKEWCAPHTAYAAEAQMSRCARWRLHTRGQSRSRNDNELPLRWCLAAGYSRD